MTDRSRRSVAMIAAAAVVLALAVRAAGCQQPDGPAAAAPPSIAVPRARHPSAATAGEGSERPVGRRLNPASPVTAAARRAIGAYRAFERRPRSRRARARLGLAFGTAPARELVSDPPRTPRHALPALRPLVVASDGRRGFTATALTRRGELYLVLDLERIRGRFVVTALG